MAHQPAPLTRAQLQQIDVVEAETVGGDAPVVFGHAADGFGDQALAGARFAHRAAHLALGQRHADAIDRLDRPFGGHKFNRQIADIE